jgi:BirA family transcriptional regulator, biotin operon repressor / biotin---[acetyl-CoA-carboxylase] ligase
MLLTMEDLKTVEFHFSLLDSTNDWGKKNILHYDRSVITLISAEEQSAGRGQYGRKWLAPAGFNIYASFCFFIDESHPNIPALTQVMALSIVQSLTLTDIDFRIKWPNDILVKGRKIAGILCETTHSSPQIGVILGVGLNVNMPKELLDQINQPATSLLIETGSEWHIPTILSGLKDQFSKDLSSFFRKDFSPFQNVWNRLILS